MPWFGGVYICGFLLVEALFIRFDVLNIYWSLPFFLPYLSVLTYVSPHM
jgi:hypothetical protein